MRRPATTGLFLVFLLVSCNRDGALREAVVGTWSREIVDPTKKQVETLSFKSDGSCAREIDAVHHLSDEDAAKLGKKELLNKSSTPCHWEIKDKKLIRKFESTTPYVMTQDFEVVNDELRIVVSAKLTETFKKK